MAKYSYVIRNQRTGIMRQFVNKSPYYYVGDMVKVDGEMWTIVSRNF